MFAYRKPFAAASYAHVAGWPFAIDFKIALVIAQIAGYAAAKILYRELVAVATSIHPYSRYDALPSELSKLTLADCKAWHKQHMTPRNAVLVAAGDVDPDAFAKAAEKAFGAWQGEKPASPRFSEPQPETERHLYLVDRPGSGQSQVLVGRLGPVRQTPDWPSLAVMNQVLLPGSNWPCV